MLKVKNYLWVDKCRSNEDTRHKTEKHCCDRAELGVYTLFNQSNQHHHHNEAVYSRNDSRQHQLNDRKG